MLGMYVEFHFSSQLEHKRWHLPDVENKDLRWTNPGAAMMYVLSSPLDYKKLEF